MFYWFLSFYKRWSFTRRITFIASRGFFICWGFYGLICFNLCCVLKGFIRATVLLPWPVCTYRILEAFSRRRKLESRRLRENSDDEAGWRPERMRLHTGADYFFFFSVEQANIKTIFQSLPFISRTPPLKEKWTVNFHESISVCVVCERINLTVLQRRLVDILTTHAL